MASSFAQFQSPESDPQAAQVSADALMRQYYHTTRVAVLIPVLQALATGASVGVALGSLAALAEYAHPWKIMFFSGFSVQASVWGLLLRRWLRITWTLESWSPQAPEPVQNTTIDTLRLELKQANRIQLIYVNIAPAKIYVAARLVVSGKQFSENELVGKVTGLSQREFRVFRDELLRRQFLVWRNPDAPKQGAELTPAGMDLFQQLSAVASTPLSQSFTPA